MSFIDSLVPNVVTKVIDYVGENFKSDFAKEQAKIKLSIELQKQLQDAWNKEQENLTKRLQYDMTSDSWLSKNIRPLTMIYLMLLFTYSFFYTVDKEVVSLLQQLLLVVFMFYFGARSFEKIAKIFNK